MRNRTIWTRRNEVRMKKRGCFLALVLVMSMVMLTGCGTTIPDMTKEQRQEISEYAVSLLLKYDKNRESRLVDLSLYEEDAPVNIPEDVLSQDKEGMDPVEDTPTIEIEDNPAIQTATLEELFQLPETVKLTYLDYILADVYPDGADEYSSVEAMEGKKLLVLKFELSNTGENPKSINIITKGLQFRVKINDDKEKLTILPFTLTDELSTYMDTLVSGQSVNLVLLAEFDKADVADISSIHLSVATADKKDTIRLY